MLAARHDEIATFGFDSWNSKNQRYLALAYPGKGLDGQFVSVYFKIKNGEGFAYLEIYALDDECQLLVTARRVDEEIAPEHLQSAMPTA